MTCLFSFSDRKLEVLALRALQSVEVVTGTLWVWLYPNEDRYCSAFGADWAHNGIGISGGRRELGSHAIAHLDDLDSR